MLNDSGTTKQSIAATAAVCGKDLQPRSRVLMGFASLADTMSASGLVFCVANPSADANALRNGLDWACGPGAANCTAIQPGQPCYEPNNLTALASYAYNDYYQRTRASGGSCSFNNTAMTTTSDPSKRFVLWIYLPLVSFENNDLVELCCCMTYLMCEITEALIIESVCGWYSSPSSSSSLL